MVHRIIPHGQGFGGALRYVIETRRGTVIDSTFDPGAAPNQMAAEMYDVARMNPRVDKPVGHFVLSLPPGESLSDQKWSQAARSYLEKLGYTDNPFAVVRHHNTDNDHVHIVLSRIRWDGKCTSTSYERERGLEALRAIEKDFGLSSPSPRGRQRDSIPGPQLHAALRKDEPNFSHELRTLLREAALGRPTMSQFLTRTEEAGVRVRLNVASTGYVSGIVYEHGPLTIAGRQLGRDFSWKGLQDRLGVRCDPEADRESLRQFGRQPGLPAAGDTSWPPAARDALAKELRTIPARREAPLRDAQASLRQAGPLGALLQASYIVQSLSSPTAAVRAVLRHTSGLAGLDQLFTFAGAVRSPGAALSLSLSLLRRSARQRPAARLERTVLLAYERAAETGSPTPEVMDARLREAGIRRGPRGTPMLAEASPPARLQWIERSTSTEANVRLHLSALGTESFDLRISGGPFRKPMTLANLRADEVLGKVDLYRAWNAKGARIEVRPHDRSGFHAVRGISAEQLQSAASLGFQPALVVQTATASKGRAATYDVAFRFTAGGSRAGDTAERTLRRAYGLLFDRPVARPTAFAPLAGFTVDGRFAAVAAAGGAICPRSSRLLAQLEAHQKGEELAVARTLAGLGVPGPREMARSLGRAAPTRTTDLAWARRAVEAGVPAETVWRVLAFQSSRSLSLPVKQVQHATRVLAAARSGQGLAQAAGLALRVAASALGVPTAVLKLAGLALDVIKGVGHER
jgi:relaxase-like protein